MPNMFDREKLIEAAKVKAAELRQEMDEERNSLVSAAAKAVQETVESHGYFDAYEVERNLRERGVNTRLGHQKPQIEALERGIRQLDLMTSKEVEVEDGYLATNVNYL